ncbi:uncharacterized protein KIAA2013 homolog isoform X2 [Aplysia californica]|nr:uncharacterized protein KIAA2013 homolog isoform X2 [Aplysia californica]
MVIVLILGLIYYLVPYFFHLDRRKAIQVDSATECLNQNLAQFQSRLDHFDAFVSGDFEETISGAQRLAYVGNGKIAAALGSDNGLYIRLYRALSQPVKFWPIVQTHLEGHFKASTVLDVRAGLAYKTQVLSTIGGCVSVGSQVYAHRSRPSLLVQDIRVQNPTSTPISIEFDQVGASGWDGVKIESGSSKNSAGQSVSFQIYSGTVEVTKSELVVAIAIATVSVGKNMVKVDAQSTSRFHILTAVQYTHPLSAKEAPRYLADLVLQVKGDLEKSLQINEKLLRQEHTKVWGMLWFSGFSISHSKASGALNGDRINKTFYHVLSNAPAPLHDVATTAQQRVEVQKVLYFPDRCYGGGHSSLVADTLWIDPEDESQVARVVTTWMITLEKQGCMSMVQAGAEGILQAMILSLGPLQFKDHHLEMASKPSDLHRDLHFRRINYGNNTHVNISVMVGEDNKAILFAALDRNDKPYYACDAGCLDPPVPLSNALHQFPVKLTDPLTSILYITSDKQHMEELKHAIHVREINLAPPHEHHVLALHKHGHHFGGLPTIFWVSIAFLIVVFHLFLFKLIYNEYCQGQERFTRSRYNL